MALKALIFGTDDIYPKLKSLYDAEAQRGTLEIVSLIEDTNRIEEADNLQPFELAIISSKKDFYRRMKILEAQGFPRNRIIDGRVFQVPNLDFPRLLDEGIAYGVIEKIFWQGAPIYPQISAFPKKKSEIHLGVRSYITEAELEGKGKIFVGNFSGISKKITFELRMNNGHNYRNVSSYESAMFDWEVPREFYPSRKRCKIFIGNDVWVGIGCIFKSANPNKPLIIGDGAVIASDSVVVKNVPPYAIVGGNPAQIIKFRFSEDVIEALLRIKWWDWDLDKIHDNFKYFNDIEKFISLHDRS